MAVVATVVLDGVIRATWDDATEAYTEFAADGTTVTLTRAYTPVELAQKADRASRTQLQTNGNTLRTQIETGITALLADVADLTAIQSQAAPANLAAMWTRHQLLAAGLKRTDKAVIGLARIISGSLNTTDTGN